MTPLIPIENIPMRDNVPVCLEVGIVAEADDAPVSVMVLGMTMTPEETAQATAEVRKKIEAVGTLMGREAPPELLEKLEQLEEEEGEHKAVVFGPYEVCWN